VVAKNRASIARRSIRWPSAFARIGGTTVRSIGQIEKLQTIKDKR